MDFPETKAAGVADGFLPNPGPLHELERRSRSMSRILKRAGSETGAPIATAQGFNARILSWKSLPILLR
jgi:hypothetical protein